MRNYFTEKFEEVHRFEGVRHTPFTNDELKEALPFKEDRDEYLRLFKELYKEALLFQCHPELGLVKHQAYPNELEKIYKNLLDFCLLKNLFDYEEYSELGGGKKEFDKHYIPFSHLTVKVFRYTEFTSAYIIETLDEYRLRIEECFAQLYNWYLNLRYGIVECYGAKNDEYILNLYKYDDEEQRLKLCTLSEVKTLFSKIKSDLEKCEKEIAEMALFVPEENDSNFLEKYDQWFDRRKQLAYEYEKLEDCLYTVENVLNENEGNDVISDRDIERITIPQFEHNTILYIYRGDIKCHKHKHTMIQATAIVSGRNGSTIELNVEYCKECNKYLLRYQSFEEYRKKYGIVIGNFREVYNGQFDGSFDLALESPLKLSGYSVSQKEGLRQSERHYILATVIYNRIMTKGEVIRYLNYFIKMQGVKTGNEVAVRKWKEDLMFVQEYDKSIQPKVYISEIKRY